MRYLEYLKKTLNRTAIRLIIIGNDIYCLNSFRSRPIANENQDYSLKFGKTKEQAVICLGKNFRQQTKLNDFTFSTAFLKDEDLRRKGSFPAQLDLHHSNVLTNKGECCHIVTKDVRKISLDDYLVLYYQELPEIVSKMENSLLRITTTDGKAHLVSSREIVWAQPGKNDSCLIEFTLNLEKGESIAVKCDDYGDTKITYNDEKILDLEPVSWMYRIKRVLDEWWENMFAPVDYKIQELEDYDDGVISHKFSWDFNANKTHLVFANPAQNSSFFI